MTGKQLRNSILQWAIQGKLVPQDPKDEPASVLLERIRAEKERLIKEKKIKRDKNETVIYRGDDNSYYEKMPNGTIRCIDDVIPFAIPQGWEWVRLNELATYRKGPFGSSLTKSMFIPKSDTAIKVYEQKNAIQKDFRLGEYFVSNEKFESMQSFVVGPHDIIVSCAGTIGETYILPKEAPVGIINQALMRVRLYDLILNDFWQILFEHILISESQMSGAGSAIKNIPPFEILKSFLVPIPPIQEQRRIVDRYNFLCLQCNKHDKLSQSLHTINNEVRSTLKKSILQEAIQGRLVPQLAYEGTAEELLAEVRAEKQRLVKEGKLKKSVIANESRIFRGDDNKYYEQIGSNCTDITELIPYDLPANWKWCRLSNVIQLLSGRDLESTEYNDIQIGIPYITGASNFSLEKLQINRWTEKPVTISVTGDLLITCKGTIGQMAFNTIGEIHIARQIMAIRGCIISLQYVKCFLESMINNLQKQAKSMIPGISREVLLKALLPLPPFAEQVRIVKCINKILKRL